jgi:RimJ/RimL family protein N-acetyltransferase
MPKRCIAPLEEGVVRLRLLEASDLQTTLSWRNQNRQWFFNSAPISAAEHRAWFDQYLERDDDYVFIIEQLSENRAPVGQVALYNIDWENRRAEYGRLLIGEPWARRKGMARKATEILLEYAFTSLGIDAIQLEVLQANSPALSLYTRCGFVQTAAHGNIIIMMKSAGR